MIYKFHSQATSNLIMLGADGDQFLSLVGHEISPKGIIEVAAMPGAIAALEAAMAAESLADSDTSKASAAAQEDADAAAQHRVALRQKLWPMVQMLREAHAGNKPIVWGV